MTPSRTKRQTLRCLKCPKCGKKPGNAESFAKHLPKQHIGKECGGIIFERQAIYDSHLEAHDGECILKMFCEKRKTFHKTLRSLGEHIRKQSEGS